MGLTYANLDQRTRALMLAEVNFDVKQGSLYLSPRLAEQGRRDYEGLLRSAIAAASDTELAAMLSAVGRLNATEQRRTPSGGVTTARVPVNAASLLAEGEFNRFYIRGLCSRALEDGITDVVVYRAKEARAPRPESEAKIGASVDAETLLRDLRTNIGVDTALGLPSGPNSGLSVRLPSQADAVSTG